MGKSIGKKAINKSLYLFCVCVVFSVMFCAIKLFAVVCESCGKEIKVCPHCAVKLESSKSKKDKVIVKEQVEGNLFINGDLEEGDDFPKAWKSRYEGANKVIWDTKQFHSGKRSLKLEAVEEPKWGELLLRSEKFTVAGGENITLSVWIKSSYILKNLYVFYEFFDVNNTEIKKDGNKFEVIVLGDNPKSYAFIKPAPEEWTNFYKELTVPKGAVSSNVYIVLMGEGEVWLDDISYTKN